MEDQSSLNDQYHRGWCLGERNILNQKETHITFNRRFNKSENWPTEFVWYVLHRPTFVNYHLLNKSLLGHFALCSRPWSAARSVIVVTNHVPHVLLHVRGKNGIRWVNLACMMSSQSSWITKHICTMVCGCESRDLIWQSVWSPTDTRWGVGRCVFWPGQRMNCIWRREVLCKEY